jgi:hypothetical protein
MVTFPNFEKIAANTQSESFISKLLQQSLFCDRDLRKSETFSGLML